MMETSYKIRTAKADDKTQIYALMRDNIATSKKIMDPDLIPEGFMEEFVDKLILKGSMLVVENNFAELELIGEVHDYLTDEQFGSENSGLKELSFFSRLDKISNDRETTLVNWLFTEIRNNYQNVFRVKICTPVSSSTSVDFYKTLGIRVEGNYLGRMKSKPEHLNLSLPLSWINYS